MVAKYLGVDCLQVSDSDAVSKMEKLLESHVIVQQPKSKFDKTPHERDAFLRMVNGQ
jgi:hypothetical protein